jgi:hypothetical protein
MLIRRMWGIPLFLLLICSVIFAGCGSTPSTTAPVGSQPSPVLTGVAGNQASNTPAVQQTAAPTSDIQVGDIPDTQAFVLYSSAAGGYALEVPEGWARTATAMDVNFIDKFDGVQITITAATSAPSVDNVRAQQAVTLQNNGRAVQDVQIKSIQLKNGNAILLTFTSNSDPNAVTGKQVRQLNNQYLFFKNGKLATLTLWAPLGADNVDQWVRISNSFRWV